MKYNQTITLKDGRSCTLRNADSADGKAVLDLFVLTHKQTDNLLSYPEEIGFTLEEEEQYLQKKTDSEKEIEILAEVDGVAVGCAGIEMIRDCEKVRHRCDFGISVDKAYWGLGIGRALTNACIACAQAAGYIQIELQAVEDNAAAINLYKSAGFVEFGRNPKGFRSRITGWQPITLMLKELDQAAEPGTES